MARKVAAVGWRDVATNKLEVHARGPKTTTLCGLSWKDKGAWVSTRVPTCEACVAMTAPR